MGCDIHLHTEKLIDGTWVAVDNWQQDKDNKDYVTVPYSKRFYSNRNYYLFAILANVRNWRGFAGIKTGQEFNPISEPKGLPDDVSPEVKTCSDYWDGDGHSHSYLTVEELISYDWTQTSTLCGVVNAFEFYEWNRRRRKYGKGPESYCGSISGREIKHISVEEMDELIKGKNGEQVKALNNFVTRVEWTETHYEACSDFWKETMPKLFHVGKPNEVRIVFWFDN